MNTAPADARAAARVLSERTSLRPRIGVILGSGLGGLLDGLSVDASVPFDDLPGVAAPRVAGHEGRLVAGRLEGVPVWVQAGRLHLYEGHPPTTVAAPIAALAALGLEVLVITNAAGGIRRDLEPGVPVVLDDLIDLTFGGRADVPIDTPMADVPMADTPMADSPMAGAPMAGHTLRGGRAASDPAPADSLGPLPFPGARDRGPLFDAGAPFSPALRLEAHTVARERGVPLARGIYAGVLGPSYETRAEIRMIEMLGGHVVGMSTVAEVTAARMLGLRVLGLSLVTNRAAGLSGRALAHEEVRESASHWSHRIQALVSGVVSAVRGTAPVDRDEAPRETAARRRSRGVEGTGPRPRHRPPGSELTK